MRNWFCFVILLIIVIVSFNFITFFHWSQRNDYSKRTLFVSNIRKNLKLGEFKIIFSCNQYFNHLKGFNISGSFNLSKINRYESYFSKNQLHSITFPLFTNTTNYKFLTRLYQENQVLFHEKVHVHLCLYRKLPPSKDFLLKISQDFLK